ncbi:MAG: DUF503 domain-containing protein [Planctomycetota bacterium]
MTSVAVLQVDLSVGKARSLKEKRQVVKSILDRARAKFNVSAAEVADQDLYQRAGLAFATISNDAAHARGRMDTLLDALRSHPAARVIDFSLEVL